MFLVLRFAIANVFRTEENTPKLSIFCKTKDRHMFAHLFSHSELMPLTDSNYIYDRICINEILMRNIFAHEFQLIHIIHNAETYFCTYTRHRLSRNGTMQRTNN